MASAIPAPLAPSTANWHWKNKTVTPWAKQWFERELTSVRVSGEGTEEVGVEHVEEVEGDVELGQRKSKCVRSFFACPFRVRSVACAFASWVSIFEHMGWKGTSCTHAAEGVGFMCCGAMY